MKPSVLPVEVIDAMLVNTDGRELYSATEVQNMLLDIRLVIEPTPKEVDEDATEDQVQDPERTDSEGTGDTVP